uniref:Uncharacterized protein n=1 Tax=Moniliophthora roreri TaxID=221103 RepID=A0A0W0FJC5_MONRR
MFNNDHDFQSHGAPDTPEPRSSWWSSPPLWIQLLLAYICTCLCGYLLGRYTNLHYPIPGLHWQPTGVQIISYATCVSLYAGYCLYYAYKWGKQPEVTLRLTPGFRMSFTSGRDNEEEAAKERNERDGGVATGVERETDARGAQNDFSGTKFDVKNTGGGMTNTGTNTGTFLSAEQYLRKTKKINVNGQ